MSSNRYQNVHLERLNIIHVWMDGSQQTIFFKKKTHLTSISFIHSYFKGLWFYGVCDSFCLFAYLTYLVCWHVKCLKFSVSTCIYLFSWRQILNHFSFQKTGWGFSIYNIVSLIKSLTDDSAQIRNQWWRNVFLFMNVNELVNVLEVSGTNVY